MAQKTRQQILRERDDYAAQVGTLTKKLETDVGTLERRLEEQTRKTRAVEELARTRARELDQLKDQLHAMTIENAELRGYQNRVREFDPVTEREAAGQGRTVQEGRRRARGDFVRGDPFGLMNGEAGEPWYRRRG